jgi:hypothetical protein
MGDFHHPDCHVWRPGHWHHLAADDPDHHQVLGRRPSQESGSSPNSAQAQCCKEIPGTAFLLLYAATTTGLQWPRRKGVQLERERRRNLELSISLLPPLIQHQLCTLFVHIGPQGFYQRLEVSDPVSYSFGQGPWASFNNAMTMADSLQVPKTQRTVQWLEQSLLDRIEHAPTPKSTSSAEETPIPCPATPLEYMDLEPPLVAPTPEHQMMPSPTPPNRRSPAPPVARNEGCPLWSFMVISTSLTAQQAWQ